MKKTRRPVSFNLDEENYQFGKAFARAQYLSFNQLVERMLAELRKAEEEKQSRKDEGNE
jgi:hypothetical protein